MKGFDSIAAQINVYNHYFLEEDTAKAKQYLEKYLEKGSFEVVLQVFRELAAEKVDHRELVNRFEKFRRAMTIARSDQVSEGAKKAFAKLLKTVSNATRLIFACDQDYPELVKMIHENGVSLTAHVAKNKLTTMHFAVLNGNVELMRWLMDRGVDINAKDLLGDTPLHHAAYEGQAEAARFLVDAGAKVNAKNLEGNTPLHFATNQKNAVDKQHTPEVRRDYQQKYHKIAGLLTKAGADLNPMNNESISPLGYAANMQDVRLCIKLTLSGSDPSLTNFDGNSQIKKLKQVFKTFEDGIQQQRVFSNVPKDVVGIIFRKLKIEDLLKVREVCKQWNAIANTIIVNEFISLSSAKSSGFQGD